MLSKRISATVTAASFAAFCLSLTLGLHGGIAVIAALSLFFFLSASTGSQRPVVRGIKRACGGVLILLSLLSILANPHQNVVFVLTVALGGTFLALDMVALWVTREKGWITTA